MQIYSANFYTFAYVHLCMYVLAITINIKLSLLPYVSYHLLKYVYIYNYIYVCVYKLVVRSDNVIICIRITAELQNVKFKFTKTITVTILITRIQTPINFRANFTNFTAFRFLVYVLHQQCLAFFDFSTFTTLEIQKPQLMSRRFQQLIIMHAYTAGVYRGAYAVIINYLHY